MDNNDREYILRRILQRMQQNSLQRMQENSLQRICMESISLNHPNSLNGYLGGLSLRQLNVPNADETYQRFVRGFMLNRTNISINFDDFVTSIETPLYLERYLIESIQRIRVTGWVDQRLGHAFGRSSNQRYESVIFEGCKRVDGSLFSFPEAKKHVLKDCEIFELWNMYGHLVLVDCFWNCRWLGIRTKISQISQLPSYFRWYNRYNITFTIINDNEIVEQHQSEHHIMDNIADFSMDDYNAIMNAQYHHMLL